MLSLPTWIEVDELSRVLLLYDQGYHTLFHHSSKTGKCLIRRWSQAKCIQLMWDRLQAKYPPFLPAIERKHYLGNPLLKVWRSQGRLTTRNYMQATWPWMRFFWSKSVPTLIGIFSFPFWVLLPPSWWTTEPLFSGRWRMPSLTQAHGEATKS